MTLKSLTSARRHLAELMSQLHFGHIEVQVRAGEPCFDPPPVVVHEILLGSRRRPVTCSADYTLKAQVAELFELLDIVPDGSIRIQVRDGLPFRVSYPAIGSPT